MCRSGTLALPADRLHVPPHLTRVCLAGAAAGVTATTLFVVIHSLLIFPIWHRVVGGLPFGLIGGIGLAGAFEHIACLSGWRSIRGGARFGAVMFATLAPATVFSNGLRVAGLHANDWPGFVGSLAIAVTSGAAAGWWITRRKSGVRMFAVATLALTVAMAGPIPVVNGSRAAWLFVGFFPICVGAGMALAAARRALAGTEWS